MNIVHLSYKDSQEGAAIAAERICKAQVLEGINSKLLVQVKLTEFPYVISISRGILGKVFSKIRIHSDRLLSFLFLKKNSGYFTFSFIGKDISKLKVVKDADVIHIHWVGRGFLSLRNLKKLAKLNKPIVWTLHDSWLFTGGCHLPENCNQYEVGCYLCPKSKFPVINRFVINEKKKLLEMANITYVGPSFWSVNKAKSSQLLEECTNEVIPNCVDIDVFKSSQKEKLRTKFKIDLNKKVILFFLTMDKRKGIKYLSEALKRIENLKECEIFTFGDENIMNDWFVGLEINCLGKINDSQILREIYGMADVYVSPSLEEPFGQTFIEAMSCSVPTVAFDYSGPQDIISHKEDGYLAKYKDIEDLQRGIVYCLENREKLGKNARLKVIEKFSYKAVANKHIELYQKLMNGG